MTETLETELFACFLLFCRIGGAVLFAPGLASPRVPMQARLFVAVGLTAALAPMMVAELADAVTPLPQTQRVFLIVTETLAGSAIGLMARFFLLALQFAATAASSFIGLQGIPGVPLEEADTGSPLATLVSSAAVMLVMVLGLHLELLRAVVESYSVLRPGGGFSPEALLDSLLRTASETWLLALRLSAPFLVYGVIVNAALGMANRFAQQVSIYHATTGAVILGGFLMLCLIWSDWMLAFADSYRAWLMQGGF